MEPPYKKKFSPVWEFFDFVAPNKVKCSLCSRELGYNGNTSAMVRHHRALHESAPLDPSSEMNDVTEALVTMLVEDCLPFSIVEGSGFKKFVASLSLSYILPTPKGLKALVEKKYKDSKEKARTALSTASAVSLTTETWSSVNAEANLAVTAHYIDKDTTLHSVLLGVKHFPVAHTAFNLTSVKELLLQWGIGDKVVSLVSDGAADMAECAKEMGVKHAVCVAQTLNQIVEKALAENEELSEIRKKCQKIVQLLKNSNIAKERLAKEQQKMGRPALKLVQEVDTRWNSSYDMLQRFYDEREPVAAALAGLTADIPSLSSQQLTVVSECLSVLAPFKDVAVELSEEKCVAGSKVIPLLTMLHAALEEDIKLSSPEGTKLMASLKTQLEEKLFNLQSQSVLSLSTMLDPRFKKLGFLCPLKSSEAESRLTSVCASAVRRSSPSTAALASSEPSLPQTGSKLWQRLDKSVQDSKTAMTDTATLEVQKYLAEPNIGRCEDPLLYWKQRRNHYPHLFKLALAYLSTPASSVPCERIFSDAGEVLAKKRNCLKPATLEKLLFLSQNE